MLVRKAEAERIVSKVSKAAVSEKQKAAKVERVRERELE